jgi:hypothetical protein
MESGDSMGYTDLLKNVTKNIKIWKIFIKYFHIYNEISIKMHERKVVCLIVLLMV